MFNDNMRQNLTYVVCFLLIILTSLNAQGQLQDKRINLPGGSLTGLKIVTAIKTQTGLRFNYAEVLDQKLAAVVKTESSQVTVKEALELIRSSCGLSYEIDNEYITLSQPTPKSPNAQAGQEQGSGIIKGRIVEFETSQPLPGASLFIVELKRGIQSDDNGYYRLTNVPAGKYTLQVSFISFTTEKLQVTVSSGKETTYDIKLQGSNALNEVVVTGVGKTRAPVAHTTEKQLLEEIKTSQSIVSGISSQQISRSADRNAAEVVRKIAGVTVRDDKFVVIRGLNERYNLTYLNDNTAPSTELYSRAFSLDLIPTRIIDKIMVYKSPAPDLLADMTGGAVKIYTKDARSVRHFDLEIQTGHRDGTTFNSNFLTYQGSGTDFLGFDNGVRKLPATVPHYGDFTKARINQSSYASSFSDILQYGQKTALPNLQLTANYYDSFKLGKRSVSMLSSLSYKNENQHLDFDRQQGNITYQRDELVPSILDRKFTENQSVNNAQLSLLQNFTLRLRDSSTVHFKNFLLQQGQSATILRQGTRNLMLNNGEWKYFRWWDLGLSFEQNRAENKDVVLSYTQRFLYSGNLGGSHHFSKGKQQLNWNAGYTYSKQSIPDQRVIRFRRNDLQSQYDEYGYNADPELNWTAATRNNQEWDMSVSSLYDFMWVISSLSFLRLRIASY